MTTAKLMGIHSPPITPPPCPAFALHPFHFCLALTKPIYSDIYHVPAVLALCQKLNWIYFLSLLDLFHFIHLFFFLHFVDKLRVRICFVNASLTFMGPSALLGCHNFARCCHRTGCCVLRASGCGLRAVEAGCTLMRFWLNFPLEYILWKFVGIFI